MTYKVRCRGVQCARVESGRDVGLMEALEFGQLGSDDGTGLGWRDASSSRGKQVGFTGMQPLFPPVGEESRDDSCLDECEAFW